MRNIELFLRFLKLAGLLLVMAAYIGMAGLFHAGWPFYLLPLLYYAQETAEALVEFIEILTRK